MAPETFELIFSIGFPIFIFLLVVLVAWHGDRERAELKAEKQKAAAEKRKAAYLKAIKQRPIKKNIAC